MASLDVFVQVSLILSYFSVEICGGMSNRSQGRKARHLHQEEKGHNVLEVLLCLAKTQEGTASFPITLELTVHMPLLFVNCSHNHMLKHPQSHLYFSTSKYRVQQAATDCY